MSEPLSGEDIATLENLGQQLSRGGLSLLLRSYRSVGVRTGVLGFDVALLPDELAIPVALLCLNGRLPIRQAASALGEAAIDLFCRKGIFRKVDGFISSPSLRLIDHFGVLAFVGAPSTSNPYYYGEDSLALGSWMLGAPGRRSLDVCCGVGTQTLLAARHGGSAVGIDVNPEVLGIAQVNAALNHMSASVSFLQADVLEQDVDLCGLKTFDTVFCNPPLLPVPKDCAFPLVGDGGPDALAFPRALLPKFDTILVPDGRLTMIGTLLGTKDMPDTGEFEQLARAHGLDILLLLPSCTSLARGDPMRDALELTALLHQPDARVLPVTGSMEAAWDEVAARGDTLFSFCMLASRAKGARGRVITTAHYERNSNFWEI